MSPRKILPLAVFLALALQNFSQEKYNTPLGLQAVTVGNISTFNGKDIAENNPVVRMNFGVRGSFRPFRVFAFESGFGLGKYGTSETEEDLRITNTVSYYQVPLLARFFYRNFSAGAGIELNFLNNSKIKMHDTDGIIDFNRNKNASQIIDTRDYFKSHVISYNVDVRYHLNNIHSFGLSYSFIPENILKTEFDWNVNSFKISYLINFLELLSE